MSNRYCNIDGSKAIKDTYPQISQGFDSVQSEIDGINSNASTLTQRVNNIITSPIANAQEVMDARNSQTKGLVYPTLDGRIEAIENDVNNSASYTTPTDYTNFYVSLPNAVKGKAKVIGKGSVVTSITLTTDFNGKTAGDTTVNPNIAKYNGSGSVGLLSPSSFPSELGDAYTPFSNITKLDGVMQAISAAANGYTPQILFSFNLIRLYEDNFGPIPGAITTADKVAYLRLNFNSIAASWYGYGSGPLGNKAYLNFWHNQNNIWDNNGGSSYYNASSSPSLVTQSMFRYWSDYYKFIDDSGFVHFLAYTDASDGVTPSTIYTDYVKLDVTFNILKSNGPKRIRMTGKNLFNPNGRYTYTNYPNSSYSIDNGKFRFTTTGNATATMYFVLYKIGIHSSALSSITSSATGHYTGTITTGSDSQYELCIGYNGNSSDMKLYYIVNLKPNTTYKAAYDVLAYALNDITASNISLSEIDYAYEPYIDTKSYTPELRSVNGVNDEFDINTGVLTKRLSDWVTLNGSFNWDFSGDFSGYKRVGIDGLTRGLFSGYPSGSHGIPTLMLKDNSKPLTQITDWTNISADTFMIGDGTNGVSIYIQIPNSDSGWANGYYPSMAEIQTYFNAHPYKMSYVLANPQTLQYDPQVIDSQPNGTIFMENIIKDTGTFVANVGITISNTNYPIKNILSVYKITTNAQEEIVRTPIPGPFSTDPTGTIFWQAGNLIVAGDMVEYEYEYFPQDTATPTTNLSYPQSLRAEVDGVVDQVAQMDRKIENLEHFTVAMLINHETRLTAHGM